MSQVGLPAAPAALEEALPEWERIFADLAAQAGEIDQERVHPFEQVRRLMDAGFGSLRVPVEYGGYGVTLPELFQFLARAGQADSNVPQILRGHFTTVEILRHEPDAARREHWLRMIADGAVFGNGQSEPAAAGQGFDIQTRAHQEGGRRVVSGTKLYSTGAIFADFIRVNALDEEDRAVFVVVPARHPGVTHVDDWDGVGQRLTGSGTTHFDKVPVEDLGDLGRHSADLKSIPSFVQIVHLANLAGIARNLVQDAVEMVRARRRTSFHALSKEPVRDPEVLGVIGHIARHALTVDSLLSRVAQGLQDADDLWSGGDHSEDLYVANYIEVSAAQITIIESVLEAANLIFNAGGSSAVREGGHFDRHWRNARTLASHNPVIYKPRVIGDYTLNGGAPQNPYERQRRR